MPFSRLEPELLRGAALDRALRSIGVRVGAQELSARAADLEVTLVSAVRAALPTDYRLLGLLVAWLDVHHMRVNVPKLLRLAARDERPLALAWWSAMGTWLARHDTRWRPFVKLYAGAPLYLDDPEVTVLQLQRSGPDPRFERSALRVHAKLLRARTADVDSSVLLASRHPLYRKRVELGPGYRADVWAALDESPDESAAEIARRVGCAYETARSVAEDWRIARAAAALAGSAA